MRADGLEDIRELLLVDLRERLHEQAEAMDLAPRTTSSLIIWYGARENEKKEEKKKKKYKKKYKKSSTRRARTRASARPRARRRGQRRR